MGYLGTLITMGARGASADIVGRLFRSRTHKFGRHDCSDASPRATNRSGAVRLPIKAGASGAEKANSRRNDHPAHHGADHFFLKARYARQVEQSRQHRRAQWPLRLPNKATTARRRAVIVIKSSEWSAARLALKSGSRRQCWAALSFMLALL